MRLKIPQPTGLLPRLQLPGALSSKSWFIEIIPLGSSLSGTYVSTLRRKR